jgi:sorbitol-specific phosphotransferase system component IIC
LLGAKNNADEAERHINEAHETQKKSGKCFWSMITGIIIGALILILIIVLKVVV